MTVEVRFSNPGDWRVPLRDASRRPANEIELIESDETERAERSFERGKQSFSVFDQTVDPRNPVSHPVGELSKLNLIEGAAVLFRDTNSWLGHLPVGARIQIEEGGSAKLVLDSEDIAEIRHIPVPKT